MPNYKKTIRIGWSFSFTHTAHGKIDAVKATKHHFPRRSTRLFTPALLSTTAVIGFWLMAFVALSIVPQSFAFTYDKDACVMQPTVFPAAMTQTAPSGYEVVFRGSVSVGDLPIYTTQTCLKPTTAPIAGETTVRYGLFGASYPSRQLAVTVPSPPVANVQVLSGATISTIRPLELALSQPDYVHQYSVVFNDKTTVCQPKSSVVSCDVAKLDLEQGADYQLRVERSFAGKNTQPLATSSVKTLQPLGITKQSVQADQTIYDMPTAFTIDFDQPVAAVKASLVQKQGNEQKDVPTSIQLRDKTATVSLSQPLARQADFTLTVVQAEADDGRSLAGPAVTSFKTSGGPKVASVSVGATNVPQRAAITVTFDQPLHKDTDLAQFAKVIGVPGTVKKTSDTEMVVTIQDAPLCSAFTIALDKGIKSGSNNEVATEPWKFDSRVICGTSSVFGYSVRGRPMVAHYFGNGAKTILFTGGIHGEEQSTVTTMNAWVEHLKSNAHKLPAGTRVVVAPNVNPDGIAAGTRYNANDVNLGRNYPTANWSASIETARGTLPQGGGSAPASEPETKALMALTRQVRPRLEVSFHSQGRLVGANKVSDSVAIGNIYASTVGYRTMFYDAEEVMGYSITGEYETWMGESMGLPAILIELPSHGGNYLPSQLNALWKMVSV